MTGPELRKSLDSLGILHKEFAARLGVTDETLSRWLNGHTKIRPIYTAAIDAALATFRPPVR